MSANMASIFHDLQIETEDYLVDPRAFAETLRVAATKLANQLKDNNSLSTVEEKFRNNAMKNPVAIKEAEDFIDSITDAFSQMNPETLCCVLVRLPEVSRQIKSSITAMAMRQEKTFSKDRVHKMYIRLRKAHEQYVKFMMMFREKDTGILINGKYVAPALIPAMPGNYSSNSSGIVEYEFVVDGESHLNYYTAARLVDYPINHYMDLVDAFKAAKDGKINGHEIILKIIGEED